MAVREIRTYPDAVLKQLAKPVPGVDDEVRRLMDDMFDTMHESNGIGLAAPQVGVSERVIVVDVSHTSEDAPPPVALANPEVVAAEGEVEFEEGCLSLPGFLTKVKRSSEITVKALDREGKAVTIEAGGIFAIALQHEMDHLDGTLILDRASGLKREFYKKRIRKQADRA
jgi:peptide deformylase